jgi:hypothetical protein
MAAFLTGRIRSAVFRWLAAISIPLALSYCVYWMPVWLGADGSEYLAWALLGVGVPAIAGFISSTVVTLLVARHRRRDVTLPDATDGRGPS